MQPNTPIQPGNGQAPAANPVVPGSPGSIVSSGQSSVPAIPTNTQNSTQNTLLVSELRDGMVIMKDGSFRAVVSCRSINFDLMSDREREGIELSYQNFLNSLTFDIQILVRSQRVDIGPYIDNLIHTRQAQDNMLLGVLMDDYINFINQIAAGANIMDKNFYIVVPFYTTGNVSNAFKNSTNIFKSFVTPKAAGPLHIDANSYQKAKDEITNRINLVLSGLFQIGIQGVQLNTKELGELYYNFYNPDTAVAEELGDFSKMATIYTKKADPSTQTSGGNY